MEQPGVAVALRTGEGIAEVAADVNRITIKCQQVMDELVVVAFPGLEDAFGLTLAQMAKSIGQVDPAKIDDPHIRQQVQAIQAMRDAVGWEPKSQSE